MSSDHNAQPQKQDYRNEEVEVENSTGQRFPIGTYLLRVYPEPKVSTVMMLTWRFLCQLQFIRKSRK
jgi:hypothetical protein